MTKLVESEINCDHVNTFVTSKGECGRCKKLLSNNQLLSLALRYRNVYGRLVTRQ